MLWKSYGRRISKFDKAYVKEKAIGDMRAISLIILSVHNMDDITYYL